MLNADGYATVPDHDAVGPMPGQNPSPVMGKATPGLNVNVCDALLQVLFGTEKLLAVSVQRPPPIVMAKLPWVRSTVVVVVASRCQERLEWAIVGLSPRLFVQLLKVGPAGVPAAFVVCATEPAALLLTVTVHVTDAEPVAKVTFPCPCTTVPWGLQFAAEANEAPVRAIAIETAAATAPNRFMVCILLTFSRTNVISTSHHLSACKARIPRRQTPEPDG
jgi:hypothetical protein